MAFAFYNPLKWKLVPRVPTSEQIDYVLDQRLKAMAKGTEHNLKDIYEDMVEAAPEKGPYK